MLGFASSLVTRLRLKDIDCMMSPPKRSLSLKMSFFMNLLFHSLLSLHRTLLVIFFQNLSFIDCVELMLLQQIVIIFSLLLPLYQPQSLLIPILNPTCFSQLMTVFQLLHQLSPNLPKMLQIPLPHVFPHAPSQSPYISKTITSVWLMQRVSSVTHHHTYFLSLFHMIFCLLIIATLHSRYPWPMSHNSTIKQQSMLIGKMP